MLESVVKFMIDPLNILLIMIMVTVICRFNHREKLYRWMVWVSIFWFLLISTPMLPFTLINFLEDQYSPVIISDLDNREAEYHIVILGGGHGIDENLPANSKLSLNALGRLNEGIRLHRKLPNSKLVLSGFSASGGTTQAEMLQKTAHLLGVRTEDTILQNEPANTRQEAEFYSRRFGNRNEVIVVTSASHMKRAVMLFRHYGIDPTPSPTNFRLKGSWKTKWFGFPSIQNIVYMRLGIYEFSAILHVKTLGLKNSYE
ncbi:YdcF family protein [Rhodohalobacter mucosus]|uniref:DUF218 domain-containing protein n=1 Tax=Rhodohalobacter mucosus TaxID=2079485 RepID=A0A316TY84_9BACT|nr:ElyC/SanA/YdcF family protein [Rhodohalobacter mucosus]PWN07792.1 hypothetical protein DDZ15_01910 [Rhodohalobacter mucosus]